MPYHIYFCNNTIIVQVRYIIIETKEFARIGYNRKRNLLYRIRAASFISIVLYPIFVMQTIDDQGVLLTFSTGVPGKGHGFCKLNISVLTDEEYTFIINKLIEDHLTSIIKEIDYDIRLVWDVFKKSKGIKTKVEIYLKNKM
jgi:hypothetical protein